MPHKVLENLCYPKHNMENTYTVYNFELELIDNVVNGEIKKAADLFENFFLEQPIYHVIKEHSDDEIRPLKNYIISLSMLISHSVIKKSISPYSGKSKHSAFVTLIENCKSKLEIIAVGKKMVQGFAAQITKNISTNIENISIRKAVDFIHNNLGDDITLNMVANHVNLSKCYFCTQFKKETSMSFTDYLTYTRIEKSKYMLCNSDKPILDIAILMGFNSQSYFTTQFKKYTGMSPKEFRCKKNNSSYIF